MWDKVHVKLSSCPQAQGDKFLQAGRWLAILRERLQLLRDSTRLSWKTPWLAWPWSRHLKHKLEGDGFMNLEDISLQWPWHGAVPAPLGRAVSEEMCWEEEWASLSTFNELKSNFSLQVVSIACEELSPSGSLVRGGSRLWGRRMVSVGAPAAESRPWRVNSQTQSWFPGCSQGGLCQPGPAPASVGKRALEAANDAEL